ncbi:MAG: AMP-binding protein, partial [Acidimicrobiales bacterium]
MATSYEDAVAQVGAAGQPFEVVEVEVDGGTQRRFAQAPATMRQIFDGARGVESTFLVYEDEEWSFARVMDEADALGATLVERYGVAVGDRVGIAMRNLPEWVVAFAAILSIGAVSVSLNAWWVEDEIAYAVRDSGLSVLIADDERARRAQRPCSESGVPIVVARAGDDLAGVDRWEDVVAAGAAMPDVALTPDLDATILYTSGTTGFPKGAVST